MQEFPPLKNIPIFCRRITPQGQRDLDLIAGRIEVAEEPEEDYGAEDDDN